MIEKLGKFLGRLVGFDRTALTPRQYLSEKALHRAAPAASKGPELVRVGTRGLLALGLLLAAAVSARSTPPSLLNTAALLIAGLAAGFLAGYGLRAAHADAAVGPWRGSGRSRPGLATSGRSAANEIRNEERSLALSRSASRCGSLGWSRQEIERYISAVNDARCQPPLPAEEVRLIAQIFAGGPIKGAGVAAPAPNQAPIEA